MIISHILIKINTISINIIFTNKSINPTYRIYNDVKKFVKKKKIIT